MTVPVVTGTFKTRPEVGASTLPSVTCCWITERSAVRAFSALEATLKAVRASSRRVFGMVPRENRSSARVRSVCAWANWASRPAICASSDFICSASFSSPMVAITWPCLTAIAFLHGKFDHRAADARARRHDIGAFDRGEDRLFVGNRLRRDDEGLLGERLLAQTTRAQPLRQYRHASVLFLSHLKQSNRYRVARSRGRGH